jgi:hypothetical protein
VHSVRYWGQFPILNYLSLRWTPGISFTIPLKNSAIDNLLAIVHELSHHSGVRTIGIVVNKVTDRFNIKSTIDTIKTGKKPITFLPLLSPHAYVQRASDVRTHVSTKKVIWRESMFYDSSVSVITHRIRNTSMYLYLSAYLHTLGYYYMYSYTSSNGVKMLLS